MTYRTTFLFAPDDDAGAAEPMSVADAIASNPDRYADPEPIADEAVDVADEVVEETVSEPAEEVVAEDPVEEPALTDETEEVTTDPFAEYGSKDDVEAAMRLYKASQTEDGTVQILLETAARLGIGYDAVEKLFTAQAEINGDGASDEYSYDEDPERPMTFKEFQEWQQKQAAEQQQAALAQQVQQARVSASETVRSTAAELGILPEGDDGDATIYEAVLTLGDKYLDKEALGRGEFSREAVANAVKRGHADYLALVEKERKGYIAKKAAAAKVPSAPTGSGAPEAEPDPEPRDALEAIKRARERFRSEGLI